MLKEWLAIFKKDTLMDRAYQRSYMMLDITREMFLEAKESLRHKEDNEIDVDIYSRDAEINRFEREVRRNVFNHLVVAGTERLPSGLVLVSIIIDIERIGDYTKNIVELAMNHPGKLLGGKFDKVLQRVEAAVDDNFVRTRTCIESCSKADALKLLEEYKWVNSVCDESLMGLVKEEDKTIQPGDAVSLGMYFRWLKRINSHLRNITTSVANPFDRIGFMPEEE
ncbi:MAG: PhoU domain-containing protein [Candidatus Aminicenantaceae bacterium]